MNWLTRKIRLGFGKCPYCREKMRSGMGGSSMLSLGGIKCCPNKCYAEQVHYAGATLIHDNGGKPLNIKFIEEEKEI